MTVPDERYNSLRYAKIFLRSLLDPKQTPRVPKNIRQDARARLKHFPSDCELELLRKKAPKLLGDYPFSHAINYLFFLFPIVDLRPEGGTEGLFICAVIFNLLLYYLIKKE